MATDKKKPDPNSPFAKLKGLKTELATEEKARAEAEKKKRAEQEKATRVLREEKDLWAEAMAGVVRLDEPAQPRPRKKPPTGPKETAEQEDQQVVQELEDIVSGRAALDFTFSDEFVEGKAEDCSRLELTRLKNGDFAVQAHLDLHGMNREEARQALEDFFVLCQSRSHRCVVVICGRGLHTPGGTPVLKNLLVRWLAVGKLSQYVHAFASAKPHDGGVGALYVLLRKHVRNSSER